MYAYSREPASFLALGYLGLCSVVRKKPKGCEDIKGEFLTRASAFEEMGYQISSARVSLPLSSAHVLDDTLPKCDETRSTETLVTSRVHAYCIELHSG